MSVRRRLTLAEQAYEELQQQIVTGRLPAGQRLLPDELAGALAVSQTPVKHALVRLEQDGLVQGASRRVSVVRRFTPADITEIYAARTLLEAHAVTEGMAAGQATDAFTDRLAVLFERNVALARRQTVHALGEAIRLDREFHELLVGLAGNRLMSRWHRMVLWQIQTIRNYSLRHYDPERTEREHGAIVAAVRAGDAAAATTALCQHLLASRDEFLSRAPEELPMSA